jgi:CRISPR-associated protein Csm4
LEAVEERLPSDSLTSALINAISISEGPEGVQETVNALASRNPPFVLSSLFPFGPRLEDPREITEALIKPMTPPNVTHEGILKDLGKDLKKIRYLRPEDFALWISARPLEEKLLQEIIERSLTFTDQWWREQLRPRVALDRQSQNSAFWSQAAIWFEKEEHYEDGTLKRAGAGLYGLVRFYDEGWIARLERAFKMLAEMGLGGERTYGMGLFTFGGFEEPPERWLEIFAVDIDIHVLLSLFYPSRDEKSQLKSSLVAWDIEERRGYITSGRFASSWKRKRVRMIKEGSIFRTPVRGCFVDVTPDGADSLGLSHRIWRSGLAFVIPGGGL